MVELTIIIEGDGTTDPSEGTHTYTEGDVVELTAYIEEVETPELVKSRLLKTLPDFYNKDTYDSEFLVWEIYNSTEDEWEELDKDRETEVVMDVDKKIKANFTNVDRSNVNALMEIVADEIQELLITYRDISDSHMVDEAEGIYLDKVGEIWGIERIPDETDVKFRERIKAYAPGFGGGGTLDDLTAALRWHAGEDNFYLEEFSENIVPESRIEKVDAGVDEDGNDVYWSTGDEIEFHYETDNVDTVVDVEDNIGNTIAHSVDYTNGIITIDEDTGERYLYVEYSFNELEQHGRFKVYVDPTADILVEAERIIYEVDKFKAGGIIVEFGAFEFPEEEDTIKVTEDERIEGHMVNVTYVNDGNVVLESE